MDTVKQLFKTIGSGVLYFFKYKKHLYIPPLFFLILAGIIIGAAVFVYNTFIKAEAEQVDMSFEETAGAYDFSGTTIVLDPGHGGKDPGATSATGVTESEVVFNIANTLRNRLEESGAEVILTREKNEFVTLDARGIEGDLFISLHSDAMEDPSITGFTTYYTYANQEAFSQSINESLDEYSYFHNRGNNQYNFQVIWQLDYPAVLIELGYLSNAFDDHTLTDESYQDRMVTAILEGISNYLN
ncbi:N-acetylmuramoyl-L-alanine amidase family protein [Salinicoccus albus]|uniref:N-acetylmuramoyl-L-alanine amidase family protein n=1 Tax=Salinicoccus albus TaxID=418756 RepID=UPI000371DD93|nr:N-acetylmuramoyl-L-alanine amidase [Salinicoccus albus]